MFKRRKLGSVNVTSPAQRTQKVITDNISKIFFAIFMSIIFLVVMFTVIGVINFVGANVADMWSKDTTNVALFNHPYAIPIKVLGIICVFLYVFRDNLTNR